MYLISEEYSYLINIDTQFMKLMLFILDREGHTHVRQELASINC